MTALNKMQFITLFIKLALMISYDVLIWVIAVMADDQFYNLSQIFGGLQIGELPKHYVNIPLRIPDI